MTTFELNDHDHITLNRLLKMLNLVASGGEAKLRIQEGEVQVNGHVETQVRKKLRKGDRVVIQDQEITIA